MSHPVDAIMSSVGVLLRVVRTAGTGGGGLCGLVRGKASIDRDQLRTFTGSFLAHRVPPSCTEMPKPVAAFALV